jgi:hypothetical protein
MVPKDIWKVKGIVGGGTDASIFKARVRELWGKYPLEAYAGTEGGIYAIQAWDYDGMTLFPTLDFFEFIPEDEHFKWELDHSYQPETVLFDELEVGKVYEMVITNFHGSILTRFRIGDLIRVISLYNHKLSIRLPQIVFERRADELIDIPGFGRLNERVIWQAIENTGIPYEDWVARKEIINDKPMLHLYLEIKADYVASEKGIATAVYNELVKLEDEYKYNCYEIFGNMGDVVDARPLTSTLLPSGAFARYVAQRQEEGAPLGHLKPLHINPSDRVLRALSAKPKWVHEEEAVYESKVEAVTR